MSSGTGKTRTSGGLSKTKPRQRWEQIAANSAVKVETFRGLQDLKNKNSLLKQDKPVVTSRAAPASHSARSGTSSLDSILSDPECKEAAENIDKLSEKDNQFLLKLAEWLRLTSQHAAMQGDYKKATECRQKREIVMTEYRLRKPVPPENTAVGEQEQIIREHKQACDNEIHEFDTETEKRIEEYTAKHAKALEDLDEKWQNVMIEKYRKPSGALIRQRTMETEMIKRDQIEKAQFIHEGIVIMEKQEFEQAQANYERDYQEARTSLLAQQEEDFNKFMFDRMNLRQLMLNGIQRKEETLTNRLNVLHQKPEPLKPYKETLTDPVSARPTAVIGDEANNPGKKLPMLNFQRCKTASASRASQRTKSRAASSVKKKDPAVESEEPKLQMTLQEVAEDVVEAVKEEEQAVEQGNN